MTSLRFVQTLTAGVDNIRATSRTASRCAAAAASTTPRPPSWR